MLMRILFFFIFIFDFVCENTISQNSIPINRRSSLNNFEISESNDQSIVCKIHSTYVSTDVSSAKNLAIKIALIESIKRTATEIFFQNDSQYTDSIKETEFDAMLKAIKSFKIENENMYQDNTYEADFVITIDRKILSMNSFELLKKYLKNTNSDTKKEIIPSSKTNNSIITAQNSDFNIQDLNIISDNVINVIYKNKNAISKWLYEIKNKFDKANIKYNLKEMSANKLKIEIISENMRNTINIMHSVGFSVIKENDTLILTEIVI